MRDAAFEWTCPVCKAKPGKPCVATGKACDCKICKAEARMLARFELSCQGRGDIPAPEDHERLASFPGLCLHCGTPAVLCAGPRPCCPDCDHHPRPRTESAR